MASPSAHHPQSVVSPSQTETPPGAPLDRVRQMLLVPPAIRPPEFENPLEKIEQLLTCPICLDRYKLVIISFINFCFNKLLLQSAILIAFF